MPIGRFAWCTGLSVKALRHYDELGLLRPAQVDADTGYRLYDSGQVQVAVRLRRLRELDLPLAEIRNVLADGDERAILSAHLERIEARAERDRRIAAELRQIVGGKETTVPKDTLYRIELKEIAEQELAVISESVPAAELDGWLRAAFAELFAAYGEQGTGPPVAILPVADDEEIVAAEALLPVATAVAPTGRIRSRHEPAHRALVALHQGLYETLPHLYRALATAIDEQGIETTGEPRQVYLTNPDEVGAASHNLVEVVWPVDVASDWRPHTRLFTQPLPR